MSYIEDTILETLVKNQEEKPDLFMNYHFGQTGEANRVEGIEFYFVRIILRLRILMLLFKTVKNPVKVYCIKKRFNALRRSHLGSHRIAKLVRSDEMYYFDLHGPGFPSIAMQNFVLGEINRIHPFRETRPNFKTVILGITRKCPLRCAHCFERDAPDGIERLTPQDLKMIVQKLQAAGVAQIQLSGGEPMARLDDILQLIKGADKGTEFLLLTSGYKMSIENAMKLKAAGLAGLTVALDHYHPASNNRIKGNPNAYRWAMNAIGNAHKAGLMVSLSLCAGRNFVTRDNLENYMTLAKKLGVAFVHILEPRAVGRYANMQLELTPEQENMLEELYLAMNFQKENRSMPIIAYQEYHQRRAGCFGAGDRYLYIDTDGDIHACPFCRNKTGNIFSDDLLSISERLKKAGCHRFDSFQQQNHIQAQFKNTNINML